ncbi:MAG: sensor histidine kinase [Saprospiraceae bacterium]
MKSVKSNWIFTIVVSALLGLIVIQLALLGVGIRLEKTKLDQRAQVAINEVKKRVVSHPQLGADIVRLTVPNEDFYVTSLDSLYQSTIDTLQKFLEDGLAKQEVIADFSFVIADQHDMPLLASDFYEKDNFRFDQYQILLENKVIWESRRLRILHLNINNLFNYFFQQLAYLILPSLLFILMIIGGFSLLIINLNRQRKLDEVKNDFINNLTHELKTPVFSISLTTKVLREQLQQGKTEKALRFLGLIDKENEKLKIHIDKVLELASLESGHYQLERKIQAVHPIIEAVSNRFKFKINNQNGHLEIKLNATQDELKIDKTHFENILDNLLENAIKYSNGAPNIEITTKNENDHFVLIVRDQGIGIPTEELEQIFTKFYRVSTGDVHTVKGFGLGLSYVKKMVEAMDGEIEVTSEVGEGTAFKIVFS